MKEKIARGTAALFAVLLALVYFLMPEEIAGSFSGNSGRRKLELEEGERYSWDWTPWADGETKLSVRLTGMKKAQDVTVFAELRDGEDQVLASAAQPIAELGEDGDSVQLTGTFSAEKTYRLVMWAEGEGAIKVKGEENEDTGEFEPMLTAYTYYTVRNHVVLYFAVGALLIALTPVFGVRGEKKPREKGFSLEKALPWATFFLIASIGMLVVVLRPMFEAGSLWYSWDEEVHWDALIDMSLFRDGGVSGLAYRLTSSNPGYVPLAVGYNLAHIFTSDEVVLYHSAVAFSTLFYAAMAALAVKHAPKYKATFLVAGTLPTFLFLMASVNYDTVTVGCLLLGISLVLETMAHEGKMSSLRAITILSLLTFGTVAKELYSPILFFVMLIPDSKFESRGKAWAFRVFTLVAFVWCVYAVLVPGTHESVWTGDERFPGADPQGQIEYMLANPIQGGLFPVRYVFESWKFLACAGISHWAYVGNNDVLNNIYLWLLLAAAPLCTLGDNKKIPSLMTPVRRIFLAGIAIGCEALFVYALYITSSRVGGTEVAGIQARYFMPMWIAMALALMWPQKIRGRLGKLGDWMTVLVFAVCFAGNLQNALMHLTETGLL